MSSDAFRRAMASFAASVTVVTTVDDEGRGHGMTATAFTSLSLDPPLCLVCVDREASVLEIFKGTGRFAVSILASDQESLSVQFAGFSDHRFAGVRARPGAAGGCPLLDGAIATVECDLESIHAGGDHDILVGRVVATSVHDGAPLLYFRGGYADLVPRS